MKLTETVKDHAKALGCDLVGVCSIEALKEWEEEGKRILPDASSVVVVACRLSKAAVNSDNIRVSQSNRKIVYTSTVESYTSIRLRRSLRPSSFFLEAATPFCSVLLLP